MSFLTLSQSAKAISKSKSTLNRAIKSGRLSAIRNEDGTFSIDPSELARAFPQNTQEREPEPRQERLEKRSGTEESSKVAMLELLLEREREALAREREVSADLKEDRDRWRAQATGLLSDLRDAKDKAVPVAPSTPALSLQTKSLWRKIFK